MKVQHALKSITDVTTTLVEAPEHSAYSPIFSLIQ